MRAGLRYIERAKAGAVCDLENGAAWLRLIAFRAARRRQNREPGNVSIDHVVLVTRKPDEGMVPSRSTVIDALTALPDRQRQVVELCILAGYSLREAASVMDISHQTVAAYLLKACNRLRDLLAAYENLTARADGSAS